MNTALATARERNASAATLTGLNVASNPKLRNNRADQPTTTNSRSLGTGLANWRVISKVVSMIWVKNCLACGVITMAELASAMDREVDALTKGKQHLGPHVSFLNDEVFIVNH